jgi:2,4-diketo-3-deoxy-L-fuconate hydrolase
MRLCRFMLEGEVLVGLYTDDRVVPLHAAAEAADVDLAELPASDDLLDFLPPDGPGSAAARRIARWLSSGTAALDELSLPIDDVRLLVPIPRPNKLLLLAGNFARHVEERGGAAAERAKTFPYVFMKPPSTTLTNPGDPIVIPAISPDRIDWECELSFVIGRRARRLSESEALGVVAGYTIVNDISDRAFRPNPARTQRPRDAYFDWQHGKWHDTFCPLGPCVLAADPAIDPQGFSLRLAVNGQVKQEGTTARMIFPVSAVIAFITSFVTLEPGDVIATGTPEGVGAARGEFLRAGDLVEATIDGIGTLANPVIREEDSRPCTRSR